MCHDKCFEFLHLVIQNHDFYQKTFTAFYIPLNKEMYMENLSK